MGDIRELQPWELLHRRLVADALPWLRVWAEVVRLPDGRVIEDFYTLDMPDFVVIAALTSEDMLVVERHYKHGLRRVVTALPAGYIEDDESPVAAAQRELLEETGYGGGQWEFLGVFATDGNRGGARGHLFLAREVTRLQEPSGVDLEERHILLMSPDEFSEAIACGDVAGLPSVSTFLLASMRLKRG